MNQAIFSHSKYQLQPDYINTLSTQYEANFLSVDFQEQDEAAKTINNYLSNRTNGEINHVVSPADLSETTLLLTSSIQFEARWKVSGMFHKFHFNFQFSNMCCPTTLLQYPFDSEKTELRHFFCENGQSVRLIRDVPMMTQTNTFRKAYVRRLGATVVELPYGGSGDRDDRFSMLLIYPHAALNAIFRELRTFDIGSIFDESNENNYNEIDLTLPKFEIKSNLNVRWILEGMGVSDVFSSSNADLSRMFVNQTPRPYLSHVLHKARIQVDEAGSTVAAAVTVADFSSKSFAEEIIFNRPFGYLVIDHLTDSILFAGKVGNPLS